MCFLSMKVTEQRSGNPMLMDNSFEVWGQSAYVRRDSKAWNGTHSSLMLSSKPS